MTGEIISIGDELLVGQVVNTNASWMAGKMEAAGIRVLRITAISDQGEDIKTAIDEAFSRSDVVLLTGGLGPTNDDITKEVLCEYFNTRLVFNPAVLEQIEALFGVMGFKLNDRNRKQAEVPESCHPIQNKQGTAPGLWFEKDGKILVSMPGVPFEMKSMMETSIIPKLLEKNKQQFIIHKTIMTHGIGESHLAELIKEWEAELPAGLKLAYLPQPGIVRLRLSGIGQYQEDLNSLITQQTEKLLEYIPDLVFGYDDSSMEEAVGDLLKTNKASISTAESCTGGYIAHLVTSVPGSSVYFNGSAVTYSNESKMAILDVSEKSLIDYGAVSEAVVSEMAEGSRRIFGTTYALASSGIAGPDGGTEEKPIGTIWIALAGPEKTTAKKFLFGLHRGRNIRRSALAALNMLRLELIKS